MTDERYVVITVECPICKTKQKVHVDAGTGPTEMSDQTVHCIKCSDRFRVTVSRIIRGPFPA
jgi:hypothetical protein